MNKLFAAAILSLACLPLSAAGVDFDGAGRPARLPDSPAAIPLPAPARPQQKEWTVMLYLNGRNSMEDMVLQAANKLESVGSTPDVNIVMEVGRMKGYASEDGDWTGSRRYLARRDEQPFEITSPVIASFPDADMGDYRHLADFGRWAKANFPAKHYMLVVWYGDGWKPRTRSLSFDEVTFSRISTPQLGQAMSLIGKVDIFAADAGMMQMAGVDYEIRQFADYILASEAATPGEGFPYDYIMYNLTSDPAVAPEQLGKWAVSSFYDYFSQTEIATLSLVRAAGIARLRELTDAWAAAVMKAQEIPLVRTARARAQSYTYTDNKDLFDFVRIISEGTADAQVRSRSAELLNFIEKDLVADNCVIYDDVANSRGIAVYLPIYAYNPAYSQLAWSRDGIWDDFAQWQLKVK